MYQYQDQLISVNMLIKVFSLSKHLFKNYSKITKVLGDYQKDIKIKHSLICSYIFKQTTDTEETDIESFIYRLNQSMAAEGKQFQIIE